MSIDYRLYLQIEALFDGLVISEMDPMDWCRDHTVSFISINVLRIRCYSKLKASHNIDDSRLLSPRYNISFNFYFFSFVLMIHDYGLVVIEIVV